MVSGGPITRDITGEEHYSTLYVIEESPVEKGVIWTGANDGPVHVSRDDGATWTNVTPPDMPPEGRIQHIDPSPHLGGKAYVAGYRYLLNDFRPYIYRTTDYGETWTLLTDGKNGIPDDHATRVVREDPNREGLLYAGTEFGLFISFDDGLHWQSFQLDLPVTPVTDIKIHQKDLVLSTMGRSFWILDDRSPLHQVTSDIAASDMHFFQPRDTYRIRQSGGRGANSSPQYAPAGVYLDYFLAEETEEKITLEIFDGARSLVRTMESIVESKAQDGQEDTAGARGMRAPPGRPGGSAGLSGAFGMHRFLWNLRHTGAMNQQKRPGSGPLVVPGMYTARFGIGEWVAEKSFRVLVDPRVEADGVTQADLEEQLAFNLRLTELTSHANLAVPRIDSTLEALENLLEEDNSQAAEFKEGLDRIRAALVTDNSDSYPPPMLLNQLSYLRSMVSSADQRPGSDAYDRFEELRTEVESLLASLEDLVSRSRNLVGTVSDEATIL